MGHGIALLIRRWYRW